MKFASVKPTIYIRVDGDSEIGLGHIYRSLALAQMIDKVFDIIFVFRIIPDKLKANLEASYEYVFQYISDEKAFFEIIKAHSGGAIIVLDGYHFKTKYQKNLRKTGLPVVCIDDIHSTHFVSDVVINHALGITKEDYSAEDYTNIYLGLDYALLRSDFIALTSMDNTVDKLETAFVCFGGSDPNNLTTKTLRVLEDFENIREIIVVTGAGYTNPEAIDSNNLASRLNMSHHHDIGDSLMSQLMKRSDFAIVPSSTILYETLAARLPVITGYFVDNQRKVYRGLLETGGVLGVGKLTEEHIYRGVSMLTKERCSKMISVQESLIDGRSPVRILKLFEQLIN